MPDTLTERIKNGSGEDWITKAAQVDGQALERYIARLLAAKEQRT